MDKLYKIISIVLASCLFLGGILFYFEKRAHSRIVDNLNNLIAKQEQTIKEKEGLYSAQSVKIDSLESQLSEMRDLKKIISERNEKIESLTKLALKWETKYFKIKDANQTVVSINDLIDPLDPLDPLDNTTPACEECLSQYRLRVDFSQQSGNWMIEGFTLTNPAYAELSLKRLSDFLLSLVLAKNNGKYRVYLSDENNEFAGAEINLLIDKDSFKRKWYEKIILNGGMSVGLRGGLFSGGLSYFMFDDLTIGPRVDMFFNGDESLIFYGVNVGWMPFRKD
jgi:hypothetical protein